MLPTVVRLQDMTLFKTIYSKHYIGQYSLTQVQEIGLSLTGWLPGLIEFVKSFTTEVALACLSASDLCKFLQSLMT